MQSWLSTSSTFIITNASKSDAGRYICQSTNKEKSRAVIDVFVNTLKRGKAKSDSLATKLIIILIVLGLSFCGVIIAGGIALWKARMPNIKSTGYDDVSANRRLRTSSLDLTLDEHLYSEVEYDYVAPNGRLTFQRPFERSEPGSISYLEIIPTRTPQSASAENVSIAASHHTQDYVNHGSVCPV